MSETTPYVRLIGDDEVVSPAKEVYESFMKNGGQVPKWVRVMANNPDILGGFYAMFKATMDDTPLPRQLKWKVAYNVSKINQCPFCVDVAALQLKQFGLVGEALERLDETTDAQEKLALEYALAATTAAYKIDPQLIERVKKTFNDAQLVELAAVVGLFNYINRFNDSLGILPD